MKFAVFFPLVAVAAFAAVAAQRTVWDGVYTTDQVARGKKGYAAQCARCHGDNLLGGEESPALVDKEFFKNWTGKSVGEFIDTTLETMPSDGPGKLTRRLCTDVTAYVLSLNGFPAGKAELENDPAAVNKIFIQPKK